MTISTPITRALYQCDGQTTSYPVFFPFFGSAELNVALLFADGITVNFLRLNADYTVTGGDDEPGTVLTSSAYAADNQLLIYRLTNRTQLTDLEANDAMPAPALEESYDRLSALSSEDLEMFGRTLIAPVQEGPMTPLPPKQTRAGLALYFDANGNPTVGSGAGLAPIAWAPKSALLASGAFLETWGYSAAVVNGGLFTQQSRDIAGVNPGSPDMWLEAEVDANSGPAPVDFPGAYLASMPVVLYAQHTQTGSDPTNNLGTHTIMAYGVNNAAGNNDCVAVSGRVRKENVTGGIGDACGVWGSAYAESTQTGGTLGMETHIYQNVQGPPPADSLNQFWSAGIHVYSDSLGSPALAGVAIDSSGRSPGRHGFYNAIIIDGNCFAGGAIVGTVGVNMGSCIPTNCPQYGIKFGAAWQAHLFSVENLTLEATNSIYLDTTESATSTFVQLANQSTSNLTVTVGAPGIAGTPIFEVRGADGSVHIRAGTTIVADL